VTGAFFVSKRVAEVGAGFVSESGKALDDFGVFGGDIIFLADIFF
jgi:hypothetical protein